MADKMFSSRFKMHPALTKNREKLCETWGNGLLDAIQNSASVTALSSVAKEGITGVDKEWEEYSIMVSARCKLLWEPNSFVLDQFCHLHKRGIKHR